MGLVRGLLQAVFRRGSTPAESDTSEKPSPQRTLRDVFSPRAAASPEPPAPFRGHEMYNSTARECLHIGDARVLKTFPSTALSPLDDRGIGRLKAVYEAWLPKGAAVPSDLISGLYSLLFVGSGSCELAAGRSDTTATATMTKHAVTCVYSGSGIRRGVVAQGGSPSTGLELWIKGSQPLGGPWIQTMHVPPEARLNQLCAIAAPKPDFALRRHNGSALLKLPALTARPGGAIFEIDSDVYIYTCRLSPCASVRYAAASTTRSAGEPPICESPKVRRAATIAAPGAQSPVPSKSRSVFIHMYSDLSKGGRPRSGGARLVLPGGVHLTSGSSVHLKRVTPGAEIVIKSGGFDRAQFVLVDMPTYRRGSSSRATPAAASTDDDDDDSDARSV
ncbi:hypothetical protein IWQ56_004287 [Coemansia nantahalensis]|nr:hypothetical protein IWQ56_004287 [Coemansia nantahalensis]